MSGLLRSVASLLVPCHVPSIISICFCFHGAQTDMHGTGYKHKHPCDTRSRAKPLQLGEGVAAMQQASTRSC